MAEGEAEVPAEVAADGEAAADTAGEAAEAPAAEAPADDAVAEAAPEGEAAPAAEDEVAPAAEGEAPAAEGEAAPAAEGEAPPAAEGEPAAESAAAEAVPAAEGEAVEPPAEGAAEAAAEGAAEGAEGAAESAAEGATEGEAAEGAAEGGAEGDGEAAPPPSDADAESAAATTMQPETALKIEFVAKEVVAKPSKPAGGSSRLRAHAPGPVAGRSDEGLSTARPATAPGRPWQPATTHSYGGKEPKLAWYNRLGSSIVQQAVADATGAGPPTKGGSTSASKKLQLPVIPGGAREPYGQSPHNTRLGPSTPGAARHVTARAAPTEVGYGFLC